MIPLGVLGGARHEAWMPDSIALLDHGSESNSPPQGRLSWNSSQLRFWLTRDVPRYDADGHDLDPFFDLVISAGSQGLPVTAHRADTGQEWYVRLIRTDPLQAGIVTVNVTAPADFSKPAPAGTRWTFTHQEP